MNLRAGKTGGGWCEERCGVCVDSSSCMPTETPSPPLSPLHHCTDVIALSADERGSLESLRTVGYGVTIEYFCRH